MADESVDVIFPVTLVTALHVVPRREREREKEKSVSHKRTCEKIGILLELPLPPAAGRIRKLERPQKVARLLEVGSDSRNLMNEILDRKDVVLAKFPLDDGIRG